MGGALKERAREKARKMIAEDPELGAQLGQIVLQSMLSITQQEMLTGCGGNTYHTHFPMPDGVEWELVLTKKESTDG
jgi:hypothetical protein